MAWAISERLQQVSHDAVQVLQGSRLTPACTAWLTPRPVDQGKAGPPAQQNRRAEAFLNQLTAQGRKQLEAETAAWRKLTSAVNHNPPMA